MMILFISVFMFFSGLIVFASKRKHLLLMLLSLEFVVLSLYLNIFVFMNHFNNEYFLLMIFLTFSVCEGVLGLSMLVSMIRVWGNDHILSFSILW